MWILNEWHGVFGIIFDDVNQCPFILFGYLEIGGICFDLCVTRHTKEETVLPDRSNVFGRRTIGIGLKSAGDCILELNRRRARAGIKDRDSRVSSSVVACDVCNEFPIQATIWDISIDNRRESSRFAGRLLSRCVELYESVFCYNGAPTTFGNTDRPIIAQRRQKIIDNGKRGLQVFVTNGLRIGRLPAAIVKFKLRPIHFE